MSYYLLPRGKLHKKDDIKKLNNLTSNYSRLFYKDITNDVDVDEQVSTLGTYNQTLISM